MAKSELGNDLLALRRKLDEGWNRLSDAHAAWTAQRDLLASLRAQRARGEGVTAEDVRVAADTEAASQADFFTAYTDYENLAVSFLEELKIRGFEADLKVERVEAPQAAAAVAPAVTPVKPMVVGVAAPVAPQAQRTATARQPQAPQIAPIQFPALANKVDSNSPAFRAAVDAFFADFKARCKEALPERDVDNIFRHITMEEWYSIFATLANINGLSGEEGVKRLAGKIGRAHV